MATTANSEDANIYMHGESVVINSYTKADTAADDQKSFNELHAYVTTMCHIVQLLIVNVDFLSL